MSQPTFLDRTGLILERSPRYIVTIEQISAVLTTFVRRSPTFGHSYRTRNILTTFVRKSPSFGHSYSTRNILTTFVRRSPTFGPSYRTRNILTRFVQKSPSFGKSYISRNILARCVHIIQKLYCSPLYSSRKQMVPVCGKIG